MRRRYRGNMVLAVGIKGLARKRKESVYKYVVEEPIVVHEMNHYNTQSPRRCFIYTFTIG